MTVSNGDRTGRPAAEPAERGRITSDHFAMTSQDLIHQGAVIGLYQGVIEDRDGARHDRDVVRHPGAVSVVGLDDQRRVILVQQYRAALDAELIEIPAGKRDVTGEPPIDTARREFQEEVGLRPGSIRLLLNIHHSPGFCDEYGFIFLATDLEPVPQRREGPEELAMSILRVPLDEAVAMCLDGRITDAKSICGLLAADRELSG